MLFTKFGKIRHFFHIVDPSPWPFIVSLLVSLTAFSLIISFHYILDWRLVCFQIVFLLIAILSWFRDIFRESVYEGQHTSFVQGNIRFGMSLFIISEVMFFFSFFWAFFHVALSPSVEIGCIWPPLALEVFNPFSIPLLNTQILVLSGATLTWIHYSILNNLSLNKVSQFNIVLIGFFLTLGLSFVFTFLQVLEYYQSPFSISDSVYGSTFFLMTGFHGFHVIIGTIFILVCFFQFINLHLTSFHHVGFECAAWYWHFVDVVWLFLYISIYWWGSWV